ncbi:MAG: LysM peptidoglycan-binding domain-containing protein [Gammaproteobacteria bacterium]|nr:LysM peptidoglycan-binding domain-containing protein [Gammaproteobacteria bacterium]
MANSYTVLGDATMPAYGNHQSAVDSAETTQTNTAPPKIENIWDRIRGGFAFGDYEHPRIQRELDWYARHPEYLNRVAERAMPYMHYIVETLEENNIPMELALLPIVESAFKPFAYSHGRASGIWQFIPSTGRRYGLVQNWWYDGRRDVYASTQSAVRLLLNLKRDFQGDWLLALAAYNSGSGTVKRSIRRSKNRGKAFDFWSLNLPAETRAYAPKLLALKKIISNPEEYGLKLLPIPNKPYFARIDVGSQIDLAVAAEMAEIDLDELYELNPGYNRWATSPNGPNYLLLPLEKSDQFKERLANLPAQDRIRWVRHTIRSGETLISIADKYNISPKTIKRVNHIRGHSIRVGHALTIPVASKNLQSYKLSAVQRKKQLQNTPRRGVKVDHIVQPGDTFWDLAQTHRVGVRQLARWNGMAPRDPLSPGQKIVIWSRAGAETSRHDPDEVSAPPSRKLTQRIGYTVRPGDSLARISRKFKVSVQQLKQWNQSRLRKGSLLRPGQSLTLFVDVMRQSGI